MKRLLGAILIFTVSVTHADPLPTHLTDVKGVVLDTLTQSSEFSLVAGSLDKCERKVLSSWVLYTCTVEGASATVGAGDEQKTVTFKEVMISFRHVGSAFYSEYIFTGEWKGRSHNIPLNSRVALTLSHPRVVKDTVRGTLTFSGLGISAPVHGIR